MGELALSCHLINPFLLEEIDNPEHYIDHENIDHELGRVDVDEQGLRNLISHAQLMTELYSGENVKMTFPDDRRSETEFKGGYKIALSRGAPLNEVKVYNLFFRISSHRIDSFLNFPTAQMYTTTRGERWILLHPDHTSARIEQEKNFYINRTLEMLNQGKITQETFTHLYNNLLLLNINERCAQTLIHEHGHVLHWMGFDYVFKQLLITNIYPETVQSSPVMNAGILTWFTKHGYIFNVADRVPGFKVMNLSEQLLVLKESFVEDYRICLNMNSTGGMIILPNAYCVVGDLMNPELLLEGVRIVNMMLEETKKRQQLDLQANASSGVTETEYDRTRISARFFDAALSTDWKPGDTSLNNTDVDAMLNKLLIDSIRTQGPAIFEAATAIVSEAAGDNRSAFTEAPVNQCLRT